MPCHGEATDGGVPHGDEKVGARPEGEGTLHPRYTHPSLRRTPPPAPPTLT